MRHVSTYLQKPSTITDVECIDLQALYECGWVHGDVSVGNILYFDNWAKITDLEYAARKDELGRHDRVVRRIHLCITSLF